MSKKDTSLGLLVFVSCSMDLSRGLNERSELARYCMLDLGRKPSGQGFRVDFSILVSAA